LPLVHRGSIEPDLTALPPTAGSTPAGPLGRCYQALTAQECQSLAARGGGLGQALETEALSRPGGQGLSCLAALPSRQRQRLSEVVLAQATEEARNRAAAAALEAYYRLAEAEGRGDLLRLSQAEVGKTVLEAEELRAKGLRPPVDLADLRRQREQLRADEVQLARTIDQLNGQLRTLLGLPSGEHGCSLWPADPLRVTPTPLDLEACVAEGLERRPDLRLLRALSHVDAATLPVARQVLGGVHVLLGPQAPGHLARVAAALRACLGGAEVEAVRTEVGQLLAERERQAANEIRQAGREVDARFRLVILARRRAEAARKKLEEVQEKRARGLAVGGAGRTAQLDLYKARGELLHEVVNWHIARTQLARSLGLLGGGSREELNHESHE
jgi:outer membrane protein TolC